MEAVIDFGEDENIEDTVMDEGKFQGKYFGFSSIIMLKSG